MSNGTRPRVYERLSTSGGAATAHHRYATVDVLRAIAALVVLVAHAVFLSVGYAAGALSRPAGDVVAVLSNGIWLFFAISGFLITGPFLRSLLEGRPLPGARSYARRRAARILPGYWAALAAVLVFATGAQLQHWWQLPLHLGLAQDLVPGEAHGMLFVAWTLSVEAMFYVFVPVAAWAASRAARRAPLALNTVALGLIALWVVSVAWRLGVSLLVTPTELTNGTVPAGLQVLRWVLPSFLCAFVPGALVFLAETPHAQRAGGAWKVYRRLRAHPLSLVFAAIGGTVAFTLVANRGGRWDDISGILLTIPAALPLVAMMEPGRIRLRLGRVLGPIGLISYGIYLWHAVIREILEHHLLSHVPGAGTGIAVWPFHALLLTALTLPVALGSWLLLERPLLRRTSGWERSSRGVASSSDVDTPVAVTASA